MAFTPIGDEFQVTTTLSNYLESPNVDTYANGNYIASWREFQSNPSSFDLAFNARRYNREDNPLGDRFKVDMPDRASNPEIALATDGDFVIAWLDPVYDSLTGQAKTDIRARRYNSDGIPQGDRLNVASFPSSTYCLDIEVAPNGDFAIVWADPSAGNNIYARFYNSDGIPQGSQFQVNSRETGPQREEDLSMVMTADGSFVVTWSNYSYGRNTSEIFARHFNRDGTPKGSEFQVNSSTPGDQIAPDIAARADGDFAIAWHTSNSIPNDLGDISAQRYNRDGSPEGGEFRVNSFSSNSASDPHIAFDPEGNFAIAWSEYNYPSEQLSYLYARYYNSAGIPQTGGTLIKEFNQFLYNFTVRSDIAATLNREYVITWVGRIDGNLDAVITRRYRGSNEDSLDITGTDASESFVGSELSDKIAGAGGNDTITGVGGDDDLSGNTGNDSLSGQAGQDTARGGADNDTLFGGLGTDFLFGNQDDDLLDGNEDNDAVFGGKGNDIVNGSSGNDSIGGGLGSDRLDGNVGNDTMIGGGENDSLIGGEGSDILNGISPLSDNQGQGEIDTLTGGSEGDIFILGTQTRNYYDDGDDDSPGLNDYALITDLKNTLNESDKLKITPGIKYVASEAPTSLGFADAAGLFIDTDKSGNFSKNDELVAVVLNITPSNLLKIPTIISFF